MDAQPDKLKATLGILSEGRALSGAEATKAFEIILNGEATPSQIGAFLSALRVRGETVDEIAAGVSVMRANALKVKVPTHVLDTCGTGGDGSGSYNISRPPSHSLLRLAVPMSPNTATVPSVQNPVHQKFWNRLV